MAEYSISLPSYMPVDTTEHVLMNISWIKEAVSEAGYSTDTYHFRSAFSVGELSCECESEEELKAESLGQNAVFHTTSMIFAFEEISISFTFSPANFVNEGKNVYVHSNDKTVLSNVVAKLKIHAQEKTDSPANSIIINANGVNSSNIVVGAGNTTSIQTSATATKKSFWKDIWAGILKNIIWVILVAAVLIGLAILGITQPSWLKL